MTFVVVWRDFVRKFSLYSSPWLLESTFTPVGECIKYEHFVGGIFALRLQIVSFEISRKSFLGFELPTEWRRHWEVETAYCTFGGSVLQKFQPRPFCLEAIQNFAFNQFRSSGEGIWEAIIHARMAWIWFQGEFVDLCEILVFLRVKFWGESTARGYISTRWPKKLFCMCRSECQ